MTKVIFRCKGRNEKMFVFNSHKEMDYVPLIGDEIVTRNSDFAKATFRIKPWFSIDKSLKNQTHLNFKVISRTYYLNSNTWELICEPTAESLLFLLSNIKTKY